MSMLSDLRTSEQPLPCGDVALYCRSVAPAGETWAQLGVLHGYGEHSGRHAHFMRWMAERGVACHALDFRGHGMAAGGRGAVQQWQDYFRDVEAFLGCEELWSLESAPRFLLAHSHGALVLTAALLEKGDDPALGPIAGCIFTAPYFRSALKVPAYKQLLARVVDPVLPALRIPNGLRDEWMSSDDRLVQESRADPLLQHTATPRWYNGCLQAQPGVLARAGEFRHPLLILMGDADPVADPRAAHDFFLRAASPDKTYRLYPDHLHELLRESDRETIFGHILDWMRQRAG